MYWKVIAAIVVALLAVFVVSFSLFVANTLEFGEGPRRIYTYEGDVSRGWDARLISLLAVVAWFLLFAGVQIVTGLPSWIVLMAALLVGGVLLAVMGLGLGEGISALGRSM